MSQRDANSSQLFLIPASVTPVEHPCVAILSSVVLLLSGASQQATSVAHKKMSIIKLSVLIFYLHLTRIVASLQTLWDLACMFLFW